MTRRLAAAVLALALVACSNGSDNDDAATRTTRRSTTSTTSSPTADATESTTTTTATASSPRTTARRTPPASKQRLRADGPLTPADVALLGEFATARGDLFLVDSKTGVRQLVFDGDPELNAVHMAWSPDGSQLAFQLFGAGGYKPNFEGRHIVPLQLAVLDMTMGRTRIVSDHGAVSDSTPKWSPNGKYLAYVLDEGKGEPPHVAVVDVAAGTEQATKATGAFLWAPDSRSVFFDACSYCGPAYVPLHRAPIDGGAATPFADPTESGDTNDIPPIDAIFYDDATTTLRADKAALRVDRRDSGGTAHPMVVTLSPKRFIALPGQNAWWLGDGTKALYQDGSTLGVVDTATCAPRPANPPCGTQRAFETSGIGVCYPRPSPDGKWAVFSTCPFPSKFGGGNNPATWYVVEVATGKPRQLLGYERGTATSRAVWLSNDQLLVPSQTNEYLVMSRDGTIVRSLPKSGQALVRPGSA